MTAFLPKKVIKYDASRLAELQGTVSEQAIKQSLTLIPPFYPGDKIHDNACGAGAVTECIMQTNPSNIHIDATDINPQFVEDCKALAAKNKWPASVGLKSAQELTFPDNNFTHSYTSFAFNCIGGADAAAKEIYRTLKPGGVAIASIWTHMPHLDALQKAHFRTRGRDAAMPPLLLAESFKQPDLQRCLEVGGFAKEQIECHERDCYVKIQDLERWAQLAWSYLGRLSTGWTQTDEEKWDEAIGDIVQNLGSGGAMEVNEQGEKVLQFVACIATARK